MKYPLAIAFMAAALLLPITGNVIAADKNELKFGSVAMDIPAVMDKRLSPLTSYLAKSVGKDVSLRLSPNMPAAINEVASCNVDLAYLTPVAYLKAYDMGKARLVAKTVTNGKSSFQLMIVVRKNSPIKTVADLKGKTFAFGDKAALLQRAVVVGSGAMLEDFKEYKFLGHYDNIVRGVMNGDFDAGILKDTMAFKWENKGIRVLHSSPDLPPYNISVCGKLDDDMYARIKAAFLALDPANPHHRTIIKALDKKYDGFADTSDQEYDVVRQLIKPFLTK